MGGDGDLTSVEWRWVYLIGLAFVVGCLFSPVVAWLAEWFYRWV